MRSPCCRKIGTDAKPVDSGTFGDRIEFQPGPLILSSPSPVFSEAPDVSKHNVHSSGYPVTGITMVFDDLTPFVQFGAQIEHSL
jgi:hypothetical protein